MSKLLKDIFTSHFFDSLSNVLEKVVGGFNKNIFLKEIYDSAWEGRELKERMRHISNVLKHFLSNNYEKSVTQLLEIISCCQQNGIREQNIEFMFIPDYIEQNGLEHFEISVAAFEKITDFTSCEFAVRPFIIKYQDKMLNKMNSWTKHKSKNVRRLATEGCRPRLPWAMAIPSFKKNPIPIIPILKLLMNDPSKYVRRSVANNLNDISKDNPSVIIHITQQYIGKSKETDWILKHACRTLLKQGNQEIMQIFGFGSIKKIKIEDLLLISKEVKLGENLEFTFNLFNHSARKIQIRLEYAIYFKKKNGLLSKKVFKISEKQYEKKSKTFIKKKHSFKLITTRTFYEGTHKISLIINGIELKIKEFEFKNKTPSKSNNI